MISSPHLQDPVVFLLLLFIYMTTQTCFRILPLSFCNHSSQNSSTLADIIHQEYLGRHSMLNYLYLFRKEKLCQDKPGYRKPPRQIRGHLSTRCGFISPFWHYCCFILSLTDRSCSFNCILTFNYLVPGCLRPASFHWFSHLVISSRLADGVLAV